MITENLELKGTPQSNIKSQPIQTELGKAPESWYTLLGLAKKFYPDIPKPQQRRGPIKRILTSLVETNPELIGRFRKQGGVLTYYSPTVVEQVGNILEELQGTRIPRRQPTEESIVRYRITQARQRKWQETLRYIASEQSVLDASENTSQVLDLVKDKRGSIRWYALGKNPQLLVSIVETEIQRFLDAGFELNFNNLLQHGLPGIRDAILRRYPGGINRLREKLGTPSKRVPYNYWQDPENIRREAQVFCEREGNINAALLVKKGQAGLSAAVSNNYPGSWIQLKRDLGIDLKYKPAGYWTTGKVEEEARILLGEHKQLTHNSLKRQGKGDLLYAIKTIYPGGIRQLRHNLNTPDVTVKPNGYWSQERIDQEVKEFYTREGVVTVTKLRAAGKGDLLAVIQKTKGGLYKVLTRLGIQPNRRPVEYWTKEKILEEAREIYLTAGRLSHNYLVQIKRSDLSTVIVRRYPGGWKQLKEDLNINNPEQTISPEQANEQLRRLLEESL